MKELTQEQVQDVNGGILFAIVPLWMGIGVICTELAVIGAIAADSV